MADSAGVQLVCVGTSHKTATLPARERFALIGAPAVELTRELQDHPDVLEVVALATCNRSELYMAVTDTRTTTPLAVATFARIADADPEALSTMLAVHEGESAVTHLMRVAAGVESVVIGEPQIQGQLKQALEHAHAAETCGAILDRLLRAALEVGKRVRTETAVGAGRASVGSVAAELIEQRCGSLADRRFVIIGAGAMSELVVRSLRARGATDIVVANRSTSRAERIAAHLDVTVASLDDLDELLITADAVISATNAPHVVLDVDRVIAAMQHREQHELTLLDLAVPRDIDARVTLLRGCTLFDLDDLERVVAETMRLRRQELDAASVMVAEGAAAYGAWMRSRDAVPAIIDLRSAAEGIRGEELQRFFRRHGDMSPEDQRRIELLTRGIVNRLLHAPTEHLRQRAAGADGPPDSDDPWMRAVTLLLAVTSDTE